VAARRGQAAVFITLSLPVMFGLLGLVVEIGWANWRKEAAQTAAQAAVMAIVNAAGSTTPVAMGSTSCPSSPSTSIAWQVGCLFATQDGFTNSGNQAVSVQIGSGSTGIPVSGVTGSKYWVAVTTSETEAPLFSRVLGGLGLTVNWQSVAAVYASSGGGCVYVLDPTADDALDMSGANFTTGCGIIVNSNRSDAAALITGGNLTLNNSSKITIDGALVWTGGTICGSAPPSVPACVTQNTGTAINNPFSGMTAPTFSGCTYSNVTINGGNSNTISPGTYCGNLTVSGGNNITFSSGIYILENGSLNVNGGNFSTAATNVLIYIPASNTTGAINITGGNMVWNGISGNGADGFVFWVANSGVQQHITGGNYTINGVVYMPSSPVTYTGGNGTQQTVVVDTLAITGGNITSPYSSSYFNGGGLSGGYLVQ
jgi:Flp pilus assembly protein TadG